MLTRMIPPEDFLTVADAKSEILRVKHTDDDVFIQNCIGAAIEYLDGPSGYTGQAISPQKWSFKTGWFCTPMRIPLGPIISVDAVKYRDVDNFEQTIPGTEFYTHFDPEGYYLKPISSWPSTYARDDAVTIEFTAGMPVIPRTLRAATLMLASHLYTNREIQVDVQTFPTGFGFWDLIAPHRRVF